MGKLGEKFTKQRIREFCNRIGGKIKTDKFLDTYACVIRTDELDWEKSHKLMQETKKLLKDIPEIQALSVFKCDTDFSVQTNPLHAVELWSYYTQPEEIEVGVQSAKGGRTFYISAKKSRELGGVNVVLEFSDSRIAAHTAGQVKLKVVKEHTSVGSVVDLDILNSAFRELKAKRVQGVR